MAPALHFGQVSPQSKMLEGKCQFLELQIFCCLFFFFPLDNFQIVLVSVPIAQVSVPAAPQRQCQGKMLMLN